jgi:hypothetical protein
MPRRSLVLTGANTSAPNKAPTAATLGTPPDFLAALARFNTAPDGGSPRSPGMETCYGPGFVVEFPKAQSPKDSIVQAMVTLNEEEVGWAVLQSACKQCGWMLTDLETGRTLG